jgi:hypothetical protein
MEDNKVQETSNANDAKHTVGKSNAETSVGGDRCTSYGMQGNDIGVL